MGFFGTRRRYGGYYPKKSTVNDTVRDDDGKLNLRQRLEDLLTKCRTSGTTETQFVSSIAKFFQDRSYLTGPQFQNFERIEKKYSAESQEADTAWLSEYDTEKQQQFNIAVEYYRGIGTYFANLIAQVDANPEYKPDKPTFLRLTNNKFVQRVIREKLKPAKFQVGDLVSVKLADRDIPGLSGLKTTYTNECRRGLSHFKYSELIADYYDSAIGVTKKTNPTNLWIITSVDPCGPFAGHNGSKLYVIKSVCELTGRAAAYHPSPIAVEECNLERVK
jgi:hypothetical protein